MGLLSLNGSTWDNLHQYNQCVGVLVGTFDLQVGHRQIITRYFGICLPICENEIINTYCAAGIYIFKDDFLENHLVWYYSP